MLKQTLQNNIYNIVQGDKIILSIELDPDFEDQIIIKTDKEVFEGPIKFLKLS